MLKTATIAALRNYPVSGAHPLLFTPEKAARYMDVELECGRARIAANKTALDAARGPDYYRTPNRRRLPPLQHPRPQRPRQLPRWGPRRRQPEKRRAQVSRREFRIEDITQPYRVVFVCRSSVAFAQRRGSARGSRRRPGPRRRQAQPNEGRGQGGPQLKIVGISSTPGVMAVLSGWTCTTCSRRHAAPVGGVDSRRGSVSIGAHRNASRGARVGHRLRSGQHRLPHGTRRDAGHAVGGRQGGGAMGARQTRARTASTPPRSR